jgi:hypothetical protein
MHDYNSFNMRLHEFDSRVLHSRDVAEHTLNIKPGSKPVKQGMRLFNQEKRQATSEGLSGLQVASFYQIRMGNEGCVLTTQA